MEEKELARITIRILSVTEGTWSGEAETDGEVFCFQNEMQLLRWLWDRYPTLAPEAAWD